MKRKRCVIWALLNDGFALHLSATEKVKKYGVEAAWDYNGKEKTTYEKNVRL